MKAVGLKDRASAPGKGARGTRVAHMRVAPGPSGAAPAAGSASARPARGVGWGSQRVSVVQVQPAPAMAPSDSERALGPQAGPHDFMSTVSTSGASSTSRPCARVVPAASTSGAACDLDVDVDHPPAAPLAPPRASPAFTAASFTPPANASSVHSATEHWHRANLNRNDFQGLQFFNATDP